MADAKTARSSQLTALLADGRLSDAIEAATGRVRTAPADHAARTTLAELLCLNGAFDRAEAQLAIVSQQSVDRPVAIARLRHLIRAAIAREAWFNDAAAPALISAPTPLQRVAIDLALAQRAGDATEAASLLAKAEELRPVIAGTADGEAFDDWRDVDDRSAWFLEVLTHDGGYLWVDPATVAALHFSPAVRPIDLLWREARMSLHDGREAEIVIPAQYVSAAANDAQRLAQVTEWTDLPGDAAAGMGQRLWLLGDDARGVLEIGEISFTAHAS
jgi:type VI secretion system protein ImpE